MRENKIQVLIIDDSAVVRQVLTQALNKAGGIEVIGAAPDPLFALARMKKQWPDVIICEITLPRMDGLSFLHKIMAERPTPVVICSSLAESGSKTTFDALNAGAVSVITKPKLGLKSFLEEATEEIAQAVREAARANLGALRRSLIQHPQVHSADVMLSAGNQAPSLRATARLIAIGTSTGGTQALEAVLTQLPATSLGIVIVQHMPEVFTAMFAERLNELCTIEVREAQNGDRVLPGRALIAPGGRHMMLKRSGAQYIVEVADGPPVNRHKPSVDVLFRSVAKFAGANALGIIMTGMGDDGARGLKEMRDTGAHTIAQDEASCVVFGMPREAIMLGASEQVLPLDQIPAAMIAFSRDAT